MTEPRDGYVMVPREPTVEMTIAGQRSWLGESKWTADSVYRAMLSAAPPPPARERREAIAEIVYDAIIWSLRNSTDDQPGSPHERNAAKATDRILALPPTPGDEAVERVARALWKRQHVELEWERLPERTKETWRGDARAAIAALTQPQHPVPHKDQSLSVEGK